MSNLGTIIRGGLDETFDSLDGIFALNDRDVSAVDSERKTRFEGAELAIPRYVHDPAHEAILEMGRGAVEAALKENA